MSIGRVVATERKPNTPHEFHFWTALGAPVGIGTIVRVEGPPTDNGQLLTVYGVVVEGFSYTDLQTPLHDVIGADGDPANAVRAPTDRTEIRLYTAHALRHVPDEPLQPVPMGIVHLATDADVAIALRMDGYLKDGQRTAIPIGIYRSGAMQSPVYLDADFLLGPEAAHLNISGVSGLATKTSAVEWLLSSIFAHFPEQKGSVAAVCFNVKGPDLCFLDQPATRLDDADRALYEALGVPAEPFREVEYFAPYTARGYSLATLRTNEALSHNVHPLSWGLREVLQYAEVLLNKDDVDAKADALIDFIRERVVNVEFTDSILERAHTVRSFTDLEQWFRDVLRAMESRNAESWRTHHVATIRKVRNRLTNISTRCRGLVTDDGTSNDLPFGAFRDRAVYVIDVASSRRMRRTSSSPGSSRSCASSWSAAPWASTTWWCSSTSSTSTRPATAPTPTCARCCSTSRSGGGISGSCSLPRSSSGRRCIAAWWATAAPRSLAAWTWTSWRRRGMPRSPRRRVSSSPPSTRGS